MANESGLPQKKPVKRVVKRVVKKPVAKQAAPTPPPAPPKASAVRLRDRITLPSPSRPRLPAAPSLAPLAASALSGLLVGLVVVGGTLVAMTLLDVLLGTPAGGGWGLLALALILAAAIVLGNQVLAWLGVPEPGATSFVGVLAVLAVVLGLLLELALTGWAAIFVPVLGAVSFVAVNFVIVHLAPATKA